MKESKLLKKFSENDRKAWRIIYEKFHRLVLFIIRKDVPCLQDAEELVNDVFIKVQSKCHDMETFERFKALLYKAAPHVAIDHYRKLQTKKIIKTEELNSIIETVTNTERSEFNQKEAELLDDIYAEILRLPKQQKKVYQLVLNGFNAREIAEQLKISESTVYNHKWEAEKTLRDKFGGQFKYFGFFLLVFVLQTFLQEWPKFI